MSSLLEAAAPKSDQLNACDFLVAPKTYTIRDVVVKKDGEQRVSVFFEGCKLPWKPCKSMLRVMMVAWDSYDGKDFIGKRLTLFNDETVMWAGVAVGGIRISHMSGLSSDRTISLRTTRKTCINYTVKPLIEAEISVEDRAQKNQPRVDDFVEPESTQNEAVKTVSEQFVEDATVIRAKATKCVERNDTAVLKVLVMDWYRLCHKYTTEHDGFVVPQKWADGMHQLLLLEKPISIQKGYIDFGGDNIVYLEEVIAVKTSDNTEEKVVNS